MKLWENAGTLDSIDLHIYTALQFQHLQRSVDHQVDQDVDVTVARMMKFPELQCLRIAEFFRHRVSETFGGVPYAKESAKFLEVVDNWLKNEANLRVSCLWCGNGPSFHCLALHFHCLFLPNSGSLLSGLPTTPLTFPTGRCKPMTAVPTTALLLASRLV